MVDRYVLPRLCIAIRGCDGKGQSIAIATLAVHTFLALEMNLAALPLGLYTILSCDIAAVLLSFLLAE